MYDRSNPKSGREAIGRFLKKPSKDTGFDGLFYPSEHDVLSRYLGVEVKSPYYFKKFSEMIPYDAITRDESWDESKRGIVEHTNNWDSSSENSLANAVARIALQSIRDKLPQWGYYSPESGVHLNRNEPSSGQLPLRMKKWFSKELFTLNWADSGPGYSWPEAYYLTFIPIYDSYVVTASSDDASYHGYLDIAIGSTEEENGRPPDVRKEVANIIKSHWQAMAFNGQGAWAYLFSDGAVGSLAEKWRDEVWAML